MVIEFETEEQFTRLLEALAQELVDANIHWKLYKDLRENIEVFGREFVQSPAFWSLTFQSHVDATIFRLIRIYDGHIHSLSLRNLLDTISANLHVFETEQFRERLKDNPFVESLAQDARVPDKGQLETDLAFTNKKTNAALESLLVWRNNLFVHKRAANIVKGYNIANDFPLSDEQIELLTATGMDILNRYVSLFRASSYSTKIVGDDDYQFVLKSIRIHLEQYAKELEADQVRYETIIKERL